MTHVGLLGGISAESTAEYYIQLSRSTNAPISVYSLDFAYFTQLENRGDHRRLAAYILDGLRALRRAGANRLAMTANSAHAVFGDVEKAIQADWLAEGKAGTPAGFPAPRMVSIVDAVVQKAKQQGCGRVLVTGIRATMQADFYPVAFSKSGIDAVVPSESDQSTIDSIIFGELARGVVSPTSRQAFSAIERRYAVDCVLLGCTELPLLVQADDLGIPLLDSLRIHCDAILQDCPTGP